MNEFPIDQMSAFPENGGVELLNREVNRQFPLWAHGLCPDCEGQRIKY